MRQVGTLVMLLALAGPVTAGELVLANGSRVEGDLANETLLVSTGSDLIEVAADTVGVLTPGEVRLKDGRVVRGALVGGRLKAHTALGELAIKVEELRLFRADGVSAVGSPGSGPAAPAATFIPTAGPAATATVASPATPARGQETGLPSVTLYQGPPAPAPPTPSAEPSRVPHPAPTTPDAAPPAAPTGTAAAVVASTTVGPMPRPVPDPRLEVVAAETSVHRDALANASAVGKVRRGEQVTYLDSIDRRLWILNTLVFDGGHWIKVRAADGTEGWVPASAVREVR